MAITELANSLIYIISGTMYHNLAALILPRLLQLIAMLTENSIPEILVLDKKVDDQVKVDVLGVTSSSLVEPVTTMRELWGYYCKCRGGIPSPLQWFNQFIFSLLSR